STSPARSTASPTVRTASIPGTSSGWLVTTMLRLPGKGFPIDSKVFLPMMTVVPIVTRLKRFQSPRYRQGIFPPTPITPWGEAANIIPLIALPSYADALAIREASDGYLESDRRVRIVSAQDEALHHGCSVCFQQGFQVLQATDAGLDGQARERPGIPLELLF